MIPKLVLSVALLAAAAAAASASASDDKASADSGPKPGSHAFNWLDPERATCRELTDQDIATFKECKASANAFGLDIPSQACRVDENTELMVYDTAEQCHEAIETMHANAP